MNMKKILVSAIVVVMFGIGVTTTFSKVNAKPETSMYLGLNPFMIQNPNFGYAIGNPKSNGDVNNRVAATIWNIVKYTSKDSTSGVNYDEDIFCLREGEGFLNSSGQSDTKEIREYNESFNMKTDKKDIKDKVYNWDSTIDGVNQYDAILALLDLFYTKGDSNEYRQSLIENAIGKVKYNRYTDEQKITDSDIKAVEQAALWYFTNYGENKNLYDNTSDSEQEKNWLNYTEDGDNYSSLSDYKIGNGDAGRGREEQANLLYNYLIKTAKENAKSNSNSATVKEEKPIKIETEELEYKLDDSKSNYIVGPIKISNQASESTLDNITVTLKKEGSTTIDNSKIKLLKSDGKTETSDIKSELNNDFYISIPKTEVGDISKLEVNFKSSYSNTVLKLWTNLADTTGTQPVVIPKRTSEEDEKTLHTKQIVPEFDLKLIKRITAVNGKEVAERIKSVDVSKLNTTGADGKKITTGEYKLDKNPVSVKKGDIVTYTFRIYNEGTADGYASEITENIPKGLEFIWSDKTGDELKADTTLTDEEKEAVEFNQDRLWLAGYDDKGENIVKITTDYLSQKANTENLIKAFGENEDGTKTEKDISYKEVAVKLKVVAENNNEDIIRNEACISKDTDKDGNEVTDRDSVPEDWKKEDSRKYYDDNKKWPIYNEDDEDYDNITLQFFDLSLRKYITSVNGVGVAVSREPVVDVTPLKEGTSTSAIYKHKKDPVEVKIGDVVTYNIRVYNEGGIDGYAAELTEYFPTYLAFDEKDELNQKYGWKLNNDSGSNGVGMLKTTYLNDKLLKAYEGGDKLDYTDMQVNFIVKSDVGLDTVMTNTTEISVYEDAAHRSVKDRDSGEQWNIGILEYGIPLLKQVLTEEYVSQGKMTEKAVDYTCEYVTMVFKDYTPNYNLRDYGLSAYLKTQNMTSQQFVAGAKQYVESKGEKIPDEALQLAYQTIGDDSNEELLEKYKEYIDQFFQSYKGVNENKDELSDSGYYYSGQEDDDDFEKIIILKTFDLALRKWVTQAIVIENGQQSITNTGHDAWDDPEEIVKVDLHRKKLNQVTVKFKYSIRVYNQGNVEGYVKEITDYIPAGLKFVAEDNPGWKDEGNNVISTTLLENTLLKPGEYADVEVLLTWINDENNMGLKVNTAEISKDYNEYNLPDIDSTPDNKKQGEDDIDDAPVMLSVSTGQIRIYFTVGLIILVTIAGGTILIKKYVL